MTEPAGEVCQFCPAGDRAPAVRTHTGPDGYVYRLCLKHYEPLKRWKERKQRSAA